MTDEQAKRPSIANRLGLDWMDMAGILALSLIGAGSWIQWGLGVALLAVGGLLAVTVAALMVPRRPTAPDRR